MHARRRRAKRESERERDIEKRKNKYGMTGGGEERGVER